MKTIIKINLLLLVLILNISCEKAEIIQTQFSPSLEAFLVKYKYDSDRTVNGQISDEDLDKITELNVNYEVLSFEGLSRMKTLGI